MEQGGSDPVVANVHYGGEYRQQLEEAERTKTCPFCKDQENAEIILHRSSGWFVKANPFPPKSGYPLWDPIEIPAAQAFLIIAERHIRWSSELTADDWVAVGELLRWVIETHQLPGGGLGFRFDHPVYAGRTILHLHFHVIVPPPHPNPNSEKDGPQIVPVPFWVG